MNNPEVSTYDMGYTLKEFGQVLNGGFTNETSPYRCQPQGTNGWLVTHDASSMQVAIQLTQKANRVLGAFQLPVLQVQFTVSDATQQQSKNFFDKFFKYFHKGGG